MNHSNWDLTANPRISLQVIGPHICPPDWHIRRFLQDPKRGNREREQWWFWRYNNYGPKKNLGETPKGKRT